MSRYGEIPRLWPIQPDIHGKFFAHSLCDQSHRCTFNDEGLCGRRDTALLLLILGCRWRRAVSFTLRSFYLWRSNFRHSFMDIRADLYVLGKKRLSGPHQDSALLYLLAQSVYPSRYPGC